jgi:hypothetical protein
MIKHWIALTMMAMSTAALNAQFGSFASAVYMSLDGGTTSKFYNCTPSAGDPNAIGSVNLPANLGSTAAGEKKLILYGGEVKTYKGNGDNVCGAKLYYRISPVGNPSGPFTAIDLPFFANCNGGVFADGAGPCSANDQKWQRINAEIDLSNYSPGNYTLEIYFEIAGEQGSNTGCGQTRFDSNGGANYSANFSITPALPVRLLYFQGRRTSAADQLTWSTASEENFSHFLVERSEDGHRFSSIGRVNGAGSSQVKRLYSFAAPAAVGARYYRLQQVDKDGTVAYSAIVLLRQRASAISLAPNPAKNWLTVSGTNGAERLTIYNQLGQSVASQQAATQQTRIFIAHLPAGRYFLQVQFGSTVEQHSFVKE